MLVTVLPMMLIQGVTGIFQNFVAHASPDNLRLVCVNLRDYPGSTRYNTQELDLITSGDVKKQAAFMRAQGLQVAALLESLGKTLDIPPITDVDGRCTGGMALMTWSMSNSLSNAFLAHAPSLPEETKGFLEKHLRKVVYLGRQYRCELLGVFYLLN